MASEKQVTANRRNAAKSSGPKSVAGKQVARMNALKHGLQAEQVVMPGEDPAAFEALLDDLSAYYQPADPVAEHLVEQVAASIWRLRRVPEIEAAIFHRHTRRLQKGRVLLTQPETAKEVEPFPNLGEVFESAEGALKGLIRVAGAIERTMYRAICELEKRQAEDAAAEADGSVIDVYP